LLEGDFGPPLVIGGIGGSGTRVFARVAQHAGFFMGAGMPESEDPVAFERFADTWTIPYVAARMSGQPLADAERMSQEFQECIRQHREPIAGSDVPWGWKKPQSIHLLPFIIERFPRLRFVHVVRDGRDLAFGGRPRPPLLTAYLGSELDGEPEPVRMLAFWAVSNRLAGEVARRKLGERYLVLRFEDVCLQPEPTVKRLIEFAGADPDDRDLVEKAVAEVELSESLGRWREADPLAVQEAVEHEQETLLQFGYY
jgi:hypothetical protein